MGYETQNSAHNWLNTGLLGMLIAITAGGGTLTLSAVSVAGLGLACLSLYGAYQSLSGDENGAEAQPA